MSEIEAEYTADNPDTSADGAGRSSRLGRLACGAARCLCEGGNAFLRELVRPADSPTDGHDKEDATKSQCSDWRTRLTTGLGLPTRAEVEELNKKLDRLNRKVNKLVREQTTPPKDS